MYGRPWTIEDIEYLKVNYDKTPTKEISKFLHRTKRAIYQKASDLSLVTVQKERTVFRELKPVSMNEDERLAANKFMNVLVIAKRYREKTGITANLNLAQLREAFTAYEIMNNY